MITQEPTIVDSVNEIIPETVQILFVPDKHHNSSEQIQKIYQAVEGQSFETVIFIESRLMDIPKKIPMPSLAEFETEAGVVQVNDAIRNEFCDEDDDFFIDDAAYGNDMEIYRHLPFLMKALGEFKVVSVPICDDDPAIVREVDYVLSELLSGRNVLLVIAASMPGSDSHIQELSEMIATGDISGMMNRVNSGECNMSGSAAFMAGILIAKSWELSVRFLKSTSTDESGVAGFAILEPKQL
ncbi:MAG: AmmeMemoRadiSam system protein B [Bacteroidetes bacterium]|nr:AmmeMemoRadiSam system protein B [Bacteroidota bacterium]MCH8523864.1 AmmeMemoRadiSam system protein B [Balneolales bacterium]